MKCATSELSGCLFGRASSQTCRAPKPSVLSSARNTTTYIVGSNSWHIPVLNYLTEIIGPEFDPPINFERVSANIYMKESTVQESLGLGFDFMVANPHVASCFESEGKAVTLATQVVPDTNRGFNLTEYGATLYVLANRTDITRVAHVKNKRIGTNKFTNLAT